MPFIQPIGIMFLMHSIIAQIDSTPAATDHATTSIVVVGFLFVMVVLVTLTAVTSALGAYFSRLAAKEAATSAEASRKAAEALQKASGNPAAATVATPVAQTAVQETSGPATPDVDSDDPAVVAVIAAAVHSVIGDRAHRIVSVRTAGPGWAQEGRRQIFSSHRVR